MNYTRRQTAMATPPTSNLKWWKQHQKEDVTSSGATNRSVLQYWEDNKNRSANSPPLNSSSSTTTAAAKERVSSHINLATSDELNGHFAVSTSSYAETFCSKHQKVGRRGVHLSEDAQKSVSTVFLLSLSLCVCK